MEIDPVKIRNPNEAPQKRGLRQGNEPTPQQVGRTSTAVGQRTPFVNSPSCQPSGLSSTRSICGNKRDIRFKDGNVTGHLPALRKPH